MDVPNFWRYWVNLEIKQTQVIFTRQIHMMI